MVLLLRSDSDLSTSTTPVHHRHHLQQQHNQHLCCRLQKVVVTAAASSRSSRKTDVPVATTAETTSRTTTRADTTKPSTTTTPSPGARSLTTQLYYTTTTAVNTTGSTISSFLLDELSVSSHVEEEEFDICEVENQSSNDDARPTTTTTYFEKEEAATATSTKPVKQDVNNLLVGILNSPAAAVAASEDETKDESPQQQENSDSEVTTAANRSQMTSDDDDATLVNSTGVPPDDIVNPPAMDVNPAQPDEKQQQLKSVLKSSSYSSDNKDSSNRKKKHPVSVTRRRVRGLWNADVSRTTSDLETSSAEAAPSPKLQYSLFANLHDDTMLSIFSHLAMDDVLRASMVSRRWRHIASMEGAWKRIDATGFIQTAHETFSNKLSNQPQQNNATSLSAADWTTRELNRRVLQHKPEALIARSIEHRLNADSFEPPLSSLKELHLTHFHNLSDTHLHVMLLSLDPTAQNTRKSQDSPSRMVVARGSKKGCALQKLSLEDCPLLTDNSVRSISLQCPQLQELSLRGNRKIQSIVHLKNSFVLKQQRQQMDGTLHSYHPRAPHLKQAVPSSSPLPAQSSTLQSLFGAAPEPRSSATSLRSSSSSKSPISFVPQTLPKSQSSGLAGLFAPPPATASNPAAKNSLSTLPPSSGLSNVFAPPPPKPQTSGLAGLFASPPPSTVAKSPAKNSLSTLPPSIGLSNLFALPPKPSIQPARYAGSSPLSNLFAPPPSKSNVKVQLEKYTSTKPPLSLDNLFAPSAPSGITSASSKNTSPAGSFIGITSPMLSDKTTLSSQQQPKSSAPSSGSLAGLFSPPQQTTTSKPASTLSSLFAPSTTTSSTSGSSKSKLPKSSPALMNRKVAPFSNTTIIASPSKATVESNSEDGTATPRTSFVTVPVVAISSQTSGSGGLANLFALPGTSPKRNNSFSQLSNTGYSSNSNCHSTGKLQRLDLSGTSVSPSALLQGLREACGGGAAAAGGTKVVHLEAFKMRGTENKSWRDADCVELRKFLHTSQELDVGCANPFFVNGAISP